MHSLNDSVPLWVALIMEGVDARERRLWALVNKTTWTPEKVFTDHAATNEERRRYRSQSRDPSCYMALDCTTHSL